jgi:4-amino-4-deoxy-L-arabinose transferase-like glycosyltransferase
VALFGAALALRVVHLLTVRDSPFFNYLYIDPGWYDEWGQRIAAGQLMDQRPFFMDPLYPYLIGAIYALAGHSYIAVGAVQAVLGACVAPLVFIAARPWYPSPVPLLAGGVAAVYLPSIFFDGILMKPGLSVFLTAVALGLFSRGLVRGGTWIWFAAGATWGLSCLTRGNQLLVLPVVAVFLAAELPRAVRWRALAALVAGCVIILVPSAAHNFHASGELVVTTVNGGQNFYIGNNPHNETGEYQQLPFVRPNPKYEQVDFEQEAERRAGRELTDREISRFWFAESFRWIREEPMAWVRLMGRKVRGFFGAYEIPDSLDYYLYRQHAPVLRLPLPGYGLLAPLALLGALLSWPRRGWPRLLVVIVVAYSASVVLFFVFSRFRSVLFPALFVLAAHAAVRLGGLWRRAVTERGRAGPAVLATLLFAGCFAFVNLPVRAMRGSWGYQLAQAVGLPVRLETSAAGYFNLGVKYAALASEKPEPEVWLARAEEQLEASVAEAELAVRNEVARGRPRFEAERRNPRLRQAYEELGKVLARQDRTREALESYQRAAEIDPFSPRLQHGIGLLHRRLGELDLAEAAFRRALELPRGRTAATAQQLDQIRAETGRDPLP